MSSHDITKEDLVRLKDAPDVVLELYPFWPKKPHKHTLWRYYWQGTPEGLVLDGIKLGQEVYTSRQALKRFFDAHMFRRRQHNAKGTARGEVDKKRRVEKAKRTVRRKHKV